MSMNLTRAGGGGSGKSFFKVAQGSPQHRAFQAVGWGLLVLAILIVPVIFPNFRVSQFAQAVAIGVTILCLNLVIGYGGLISLGHIAFMGIGAYTSLILFTEHGWPFWTTWPVAALICFVIGVIVGLPALKIRGLYLALTTFALAYTFPILLKIDAWAKHTGGDNGKSIKPNQELHPPSWVRDLPIFHGQNVN